MFKSLKHRFIASTATLMALAAAAPSAQAALAVALSNNSLIVFDTATPGTTTTLPVVNLATDDTLVGIDFRPQNGFLYGLGFNSGAGTVRLYALSYRTGQAFPISGTGSFIKADGVTADPVLGTSFGFDFNPTVDRIRVVNDAGQNFRLNPNTGAGVDGNLGADGIQMDGAINGGATTVDAAAYTNNQANATVTTLYTLSAPTDQLFIQNPPNDGTQTVPGTVTLNGSTLDFTSVNGFDIPSGVNVAVSNSVATGLGYAALTVGGVSSFYSIDLLTGVATFLGSISTGTSPIQGLAVQAGSGLPAVSFMSAGSVLVRFNTTTPGTTTSVASSGLTVGEALVGIDYRPQTGQLYGLGINDTADTGTLYIVDPQTGLFTAVGPTGQIALEGGLPPANLGYGVDFNPAVDRLRVVADGNYNFRVVPGTGAPVDGDDIEPGVQPDDALNGLPGGATGLSGAAYTNSYGQNLIGGPTSLYTLEPISDTLFIQNPANDGTQTTPVTPTLNGVPIDFGSTTGFDIPAAVSVNSAGSPAIGYGYAVFTYVDSSKLFTFELSTGVAQALGTVAINSLAGLALGDGLPGVRFSTSAKSVNENAGAVTITVALDGPAAIPVTVPFTVAGTATNPADYTISASPLVIPPGQATGSITVNVVNDLFDEVSNETVIVTLGAPTNATLMSPSVHTLTIVDNDLPPKASFTAANQSHAESGAFSATVKLSNPATYLVQVPFTASGTAQNADGSLSTSSPLNFNPGVTSLTINGTITSDTLDELDETIILTLFEPPGDATLGSPSVHTLKIIDDDLSPRVTMIPLNQTVGEGVGTASIIFQLDAISGLPITVPLTYSGSAVAPSDYLAGPSSITIPAGSISSNLVLTIVNNTVHEATEVIQIIAGGAAADRRAAPTKGTITITDND